jgi:hypothetical protein
VGIEITGQQKGFISWIQDEMLSRNIFFPLAKEENATELGLRPNTNKMVRFNVVVPWFKARKMFFPIERKTEPTMIECVNELSLAAVSGFRSKHNDFIDTISQLASLQTWRPSEEAPMVPDDDNKRDGSKLWGVEDDDSVIDRMASYIV